MRGTLRPASVENPADHAHEVDVPGLGLAANVPGRSPLIDGFGLIALASVFPIIAVLFYAQLTARFTRKREAGDSTERT